MDDHALDQAARQLAATTPRRVATSALALGGLAALSGLSATTTNARKDKARVSANKKKKKRGPTGPTGPTGPAGAGGGGTGATGATGPAGPAGPSSGAILGTTSVLETVVLDPGEDRLFTPTCPAATATEEYRATGGGFDISNPEILIQSSRPALDGLGWEVLATNNSGMNAPVFAHVVCLKYRK